MTAQRTSDMQIERPERVWTPPTGLDPATEIAQLRAALVNRETVGMAMGLVMERYDVDPDAAFAILRQLSQNSNTKLVMLAAEIVDRHSASVRASSGPRRVPSR